jgi:hypothetical protein
MIEHGSHSYGFCEKYIQTWLRAYPLGEGFMYVFKQVMPLEGANLLQNQD